MRKIDAAQCRGRAFEARGGVGEDFRSAADRAEPGCRLSVSGRCAVSLEDRDRQCRHRPRHQGRAARAGAAARAGLAHFRRPRRVRQPLSAHAVRRAAQARRAGAGFDPRSKDPVDGRAVRAARRPDPADHGQSAAGTVERRPQGGAVRHPRSRRGDRARRPSRDHVGRALRAHHRRLAGAAAAPARHLGSADGKAISRTAPRNLERAEGRSDEGLCAVDASAEAG